MTFIDEHILFIYLVVYLFVGLALAIRTYGHIFKTRSWGWNQFKDRLFSGICSIPFFILITVGWPIFWGSLYFCVLKDKLSKKDKLD